MTTAIQTLRKKDIDFLLKQIVIKVDTREQENKHITDFFNGRGIKWESTKLEAGDYSAFIPPAPEIHFYREFHLNAAIERKNSLDELAQTVKERARFEHELFRAKDKGTRFKIVVEDGDYSELIRGKYRSEYAPKALTASLMAFEARYNVPLLHVAKADAGHYIYNWLLYQFREALLSI